MRVPLPRGALLPAPQVPGPRLRIVLLLLLGLLALAVDLLTLLQVPRSVVLAAALALSSNAALSFGAMWVAGRSAIRAVVVAAFAVSLAGLVQGPGGDILVLGSMQTGYLIWVAAAFVGAASPLIMGKLGSPWRAQAVHDQGE